MPELDPTDPIDALVGQLGVREAPRALPPLDWSTPRSTRRRPAMAAMAMAAVALLTVGLARWSRTETPAPE